MNPVTIETDWTAAQAARGRQIAFHAEMGYDRIEILGRYSWLALGAANLAVVLFWAETFAETVIVPGLLAQRPFLPVIFLWCLWGTWIFLGQAWNWLGNGFATHWPTRGMAHGIDYGPRRIRVDLNGITQAVPEFREGLAWKGVTAVIEDRNCFVLGSGRNMVAMLPKTPNVRLLLEAAVNGRARADRIASPR